MSENLEEKLREVFKSYDEHVEDLEELREKIKDVSSCEGERCYDCGRLDDCIVGLRESVAALAQSDIYIMKQIKLTIEAMMDIQRIMEEGKDGEKISEDVKGFYQ